MKHPKKKAFLAAFSELGSITEAALVADVSRDLHYDWKAKDAEYAAAFEVAQQRAADALEDEAHRRARGYSVELVDGVAQKTGHHHCSDRVLLKLLEGNKPEKYGRKTELTGPGGAPLIPKRVEVVFVKSDG